MPSHEIRLKVGVPIMLIRNIDRAIGLCNGTRLIVSRLSDHVIEGILMFGKCAGEKVLISR
jgi:ATP-dependent DNA helicase PIF1